MFWINSKHLYECHRPARISHSQLRFFLLALPKLKVFFYCELFQLALNTKCWFKYPFHGVIFVVGKGQVQTSNRHRCSDVLTRQRFLMCVVEIQMANIRYSPEVNAYAAADMQRKRDVPVCIFSSSAVFCSSPPAPSFPYSSPICLSSLRAAPPSPLSSHPFAPSHQHRQ